MSKPQLVTIAGICERDIDLMLLEELSSNLAFSRWFVSHALGSVDEVRSVLAAQRSVTQSNGESDLELTVELTSGLIARLLIENKVDTGFQKDQARRYSERARLCVSRGDCKIARTLMVAPERYFGDPDAAKGFDSRITYESILRWYVGSDLGPRKEYKVALLSSAIEKSVLGYQPIADGPVTEFWRSYWQTACREAPELEMNEPSAKPAGAGFVSFRPHRLPQGLDVCHKLPHGNVDLQFSGWGHRVNQLRAAVEPYLEPGMTVARANKSASIRLRTGVLDTGKSFDSQEKVAVDGIRAAASLLAWFDRHCTELAKLMGDGR